MGRAIVDLFGAEVRGDSGGIDPNLLRRALIVSLYARGVGAEDLAVVFHVTSRTIYREIARLEPEVVSRVASLGLGS